MKTLQVRVHGRVQGVSFRAATRDQAQVLGLAGWVRNREDGSVEAHLQGGDAALQQMLTWLHHGPPQARVDAVEVERLADAGPEADSTQDADNSLYNNSFEVRR